MTRISALSPLRRKREEGNSCLKTDIASHYAQRGACKKEKNEQVNRQTSEVEGPRKKRQRTATESSEKQVPYIFKSMAHGRKGLRKRERPAQKGKRRTTGETYERPKGENH